MRRTQEEIATPCFKKSKCNNFLPETKNRPESTRKLTYIATLVALSIVLKMLSNEMAVFFPPQLKPSLVYIPWYLSTIMLGPISGGIIVIASDLVGMVLIPAGGKILLSITFANVLNATIFGLCFRFIKLPLAVKCFFGATLSLMICTLGINTYILADLYKTPFWVIFTTRTPSIPIVYFNVLVVVLMTRTLKRIRLY